MLELMGIFLAIFSPIIILVLIRQSFKYRLRKLEAQGVNSDQVADLKDEIRLLRERVQVLEAIVTDTGYELHSKFRQLDKHG